MPNYIRPNQRCSHKSKRYPAPFGVLGILVPATGIEPVRILLRGILSPLCLPIPPCRRVKLFYCVDRPFAVTRCAPCRRGGCVAHRPRHTLRPHFICRRQRAGSWPLCLPIPPQRHINRSWAMVTYFCETVKNPEGNNCKYKCRLQSIRYFHTFLCNLSRISLCFCAIRYIVFAFQMC